MFLKVKEHSTWYCSSLTFTIGKWIIWIFDWKPQAFVLKFSFIAIATKIWNRFSVITRKLQCFSNHVFFWFLLKILGGEKRVPAIWKCVQLNSNLNLIFLIKWAPTRHLRHCRYIDLIFNFARFVIRLNKNKSVHCMYALWIRIPFGYGLWFHRPRRIVGVSWIVLVCYMLFVL